MVYFHHAQLLGASVFVRGDADAAHRNANFAAVGVLVPPGGALGAVWEHAEELKSLARRVVGDSEDTTALESFWERHKGEDEDAGNGRTRQRGGSEAALPGLDLHDAWPKEHPALAVPEVMDLFGPLLFPLQRAVLARKRILFMGSPPVRKNALVVWLAALLGNVSHELGGAFSSEAQGLLRTQPLFSVGIHDIASLPRKEEQNGWLACTTDDILAEKKDLWDVLVRLPKQEALEVWPTLQTSSGQVIKASQRDSRRWNLLLEEMRRLRVQIGGRFADDDDVADPVHEDDQRPLLERQSTPDETYECNHYGRNESEAVEPPTWTAVAYRGFMWWASAGEASAWEEDEAKADEELLVGLTALGALSPTVSRKGSPDKDAQYARAAATILVAYFRRITERIFGTMTGIVEEADDASEEGVENEVIEIPGSDVREMGLDSWSQADRTVFVQDMMEKWYGRRAVIIDEGLTLCGVRIC